MASNQRKTKYTSLDGGTNLTTPIIEMPEGDFLYTFNVEPNKTKGISSSKGYEQVDGNHIDPSNAILSIYKYESLTGTLPAQGDIVTESGDNYTVCGIISLTSTTGTIYLLAEANVAAAVSVFTTTDGNFTSTHYRFVQRLNGSKYPPSLLDETERPFYNYCIEAQRLVIDQVPGEGPVLGVTQDPNNGRMIAVRKDTVSGNDLMYEANIGTGWVVVAGTSFTNSLYYRFADITQSATSRRLYVANGVDDLHSYNSVTTTVTTIDVTTTPTFPLDEPAKFITEHVGRVVAASGNKVIYSSVAAPTFTTPAAGTVTQHTNYIITGLSKLVNNYLFVPTENSIYIQQGDPDPISDNFGPFKEHTDKTGALEGTIDSSDYPYFINRFGISNLTDTLRSGDFEYNILSDKVSPIVNNRYDKDGVAVTFVGAHIDRESDLYRVYRSDGISFNMLKTDERLYPVTFNDYKVGLQCLGTFKDADKEYIIAGSGYDTNFVGDYSGYVYKLESGLSLNGSNLVHSIKTPYLHMGSPAVKKRFFKFSANVLSPESITLTYKADFDTGSSRYSQQLDIDAISGLSRFNQSSFNAATWSSNFIDEVGGYLNGSGINMSMNINIETKNTEQFTIQGILYHYKTRGLKR